jgi:hypothetical protein
VLPPSSKKLSKEDAPFVSMRVRKEFADSGMFDGITTAVGHIKPVGDERWIVQYTNGKQEAINPQTFLGIIW